MSDRLLQLIPEPAALPVELVQGKGHVPGEILTALIEPTRAEPGCRLYELWRNRRDGTELTFVEEWSSDEALAAHAASDHIAEARARYPELIAEEVSLRLYDLAG